ncbi:MAG: hypothetical protein NZ772_00875 [Cyanobacteria bacterium]|nr:hypothetical protein [Cyanobacteriota bacterium]MDW8199861.1 hypothetical protein [Cyanobacteriota bacterium SKYGB_h_bin112]
MSQADVLARAKQGDFRAISMLLSRCLAIDGLTVRVTQRDACLYILLEAAKVPQQQMMAAMIEEQISQLHLATVSTLMIFGRKIGERKALWQQTIELDRLPMPDRAAELVQPEATVSTALTTPLSPATASDSDEMTGDAALGNLGEGALANLAAELMASTPATPVAVDDTPPNATASYDHDANCVPISTSDLLALEADLKSTRLDTADLSSSAGEEATDEPLPSTVSTEASSLTESSTPVTLLREMGTLSEPTLLQAAEESVPETAVESLTAVESTPEPDLPAAAHSLSEPMSMTAPDSVNLPDPWETGSSVPTIPKEANATTSADSDARSTARSTSSTSRSRSSSLRELAEALRGVAAVDTKSLLQRPEAVVLLAWLSVLVVWQLYLALAIEEEIPSNRPLSGRKLAKRLGVHARTLVRHRHRADFGSWSQDLDPDGVAWSYQGEGRYIPSWMADKQSVVSSVELTGDE